MAESNTYTGAVDGSGVMHRGTYQLLTTKQAISRDIQFACYNKTPFTKAVGIEAFGVEAMTDIEKFTGGRTSGRIIEFAGPGNSFAGQVFETAGTSFFTGRLSNFAPELVEGGDEWAYAWHQLNNVQYIPQMDAKDNAGAGRLIDIRVQKQMNMRQSMVRDFNYSLLGNASAPQASTMGPTFLQSDLPHLISVTQTSAITCGGITKANTYWQNGTKAITSIGGGGELDRPIALRRGLLDMLNDQKVYAESSDDYLWAVTQGAWQYMDRLAIADAVQGGGIVVRQPYDAAGVQHFIFGGHPMVWDPAVTVPTGATASTEAMYAIHVPSYFISIRSDENFTVSGWEEPREHDITKLLVQRISVRYTPGVRAMRPHAVAYNIPACTD